MTSRATGILRSTPVIMLATTGLIIAAISIQDATGLQVLPLTFFLAPLAAMALGPRQGYGSVAVVVAVMSSFLIFPVLLPDFIPEAQLGSVKAMVFSASISLVITVTIINYFRLRLHKLLRRISMEARVDVLTGASNRRHGHEVLANELERSQRLDHPVSVILFDVDHFKRVNDTFGHNMGDTVLIELAELTRQDLRSYDTLIRWGGEEFLILLPETDLPGALDVAERLRLKVAQHQFAHCEPLTVSAGVASALAVDTPHTLLARADVLLYQTKESGRNRVAAGFLEQKTAPSARHLN